MHVLELSDVGVRFGGVWALLGLLYLAWLTKAFRDSPPNYIAE